MKFYGIAALSVMLLTFGGAIDSQQGHSLLGALLGMLGGIGVGVLAETARQKHD